MDSSTTLGAIRFACQDDITALTALYNEDISDDVSHHRRYTQNDIKQYMEDVNKQLIVYEINKTIVAALLGEYNESYAYLETIIVAKGQQRLGIGSILMDHFERTVQAKNITLIEVMTTTNNTKMRQLLDKNDYVDGGEYIFYYKTL